MAKSLSMKPFRWSAMTVNYTPLDTSAPGHQSNTRTQWLHVESAIYRNDGAGDVRRSVIKETGHDVRNLLRFAQSTDRNSRNDLFEHCFGNRRHHVGADETRSDAVDGNALSSEFEGEGLGESVHSRFGRRVVGLAYVSRLANDRTDVDDSARSSRDHVLDDCFDHVETSGYVDPHDAMPFVNGHPTHGAVNIDTRVVNEIVNVTVFFYGVIDETYTVVGFTNLHLMNTDGLPHFLGRLAHRLSRFAF